MSSQPNQYIENTLQLLQKVKPTNEPLSLLYALDVEGLYYDNRDNSVQFKAKGDNDQGINKVKVIYDEGQDLYNVEFWKVRGMKFERVDSVNGVFFDQLVDTIWRKVVIV